MAELRPQRYKLPDLPELRPGGNAFIYEERIGYTGSIIRRRGGMLNLIWHHALIYGYDKRNTLWVIENMPFGVYCVRFMEFSAAGKLEYEIIDLVEDPTASDSIIDKAKEFATNHPVFDELKNNCEMFVNYAHGKGKLSWQLQFGKWLVDTLLTATEMKLLTSKKSKNRDYIKNQIDNLRKSTELERPENIEQMFNEDLEEDTP